MIYIDKKASDEPSELQEYITTQMEKGLEVSYNNMPTEAIRNALMEIQGGLCCYCMNRIGKNNSLIEHLLPQSQAENYQVAFHNLYLACKHSDGIPQKKQHCDRSKGAQLIPNYISSANCASYFAYSLSNGEILPRIQTKKGDTDWQRQEKFTSIEEFREAKEFVKLSNEQKMILATIDTLNLNSPDLTPKRKIHIDNFISKLIRGSEGKHHTDLIKMYDDASKRQKNNLLKPFFGIDLYLIERQLYLHDKGNR